MAHHVGERLLQDPERGEIRARRQPPPRGLPLHGDGEPGRGRLVDQFGEPVESGGGRAGGLAGGAQGVQDLPDLAEGLLAGRLDGGERRTGLLGVRVEQRQAHAGLHVDHGDAVGQYVVQLAGDPQPLLVHPAPFGGLPLGPVPGPLLPSYADHLGGGEYGDRPGGDTALGPPRRRAVAGRGQPAVQPVPDEQMAGPQGSHRAPGGVAVSGDDGGEAGQGDADEDGAVRVSAGEVGQRDRADAVEDGHRIPVPQDQQGRPEEQQEPSERADRLPVGLEVVDPSGGRLREHGHEERGPPGQPPGARALRPVHPPPLRHAATLDRRDRRRRPPGGPIGRTPAGVRAPRAAGPGADPATSRAGRPRRCGRWCRSPRRPRGGWPRGWRPG